MTDDVTALFTGTQEVAERHRFDTARLERWMAEHVEGFRGPLSVEEFKGGQSNPTYLVRTPGERYVLRRKPPGKLLPSAHAVDREYRVLKALGPTPVPTPQVHALCTDESVTGTMFYVMEYLEGRVFWNKTLPDQTPEERAAIYDSLGDAMARLHAVDPEAVGLGDFGRPGNYFSRQIARWSKNYVASETQKIPEMDWLIDWLPNNVPPDDRTTIIHGDLQLANTMCHPTEPRIIAILDWELCTLGNPMGDFSYVCMPWLTDDDTKNGFRNFDLAALGIPTLEAFQAAYCKRTGFAPITDWNFYVAYNLFRSAAILQGILGRVRDGTASSDQALVLADHVRPLAEKAHAAAHGHPT